MFALSMGKTENGVVYTNKTQAKLIMIVEGPLRSTFNFKAEDFNITGPQGTSISNVNTMNATPFSAAYSIQVKHELAFPYFICIIYRLLMEPQMVQNSKSRYSVWWFLDKKYEL